MYSYWEKSTFLAPKDFIVIGSGIVGLQAAITYKNLFPDADILVVEKGILPGGASTKNAGFACFGSPTELMDDIAKHGADATFSLVEDRYKGLLELRKTYGEATIDFSMCGGFEIFNDEQTFETALEHALSYNSVLKKITGEADVYEPGACNGMPAIRNRLEGYLHSGKLVRAMIQQAQKAGITIWNNCTVTALTQNSVILNNEIQLEAKNILAATNAFTGQLFKGTGIEPARGYILVSSEINHNWRGTFHYDEGFIYFRDLGKRILLGGARNQDMQAERTTEHLINENIKKYLISFADNILELESGWEIEHEWTGIMGFGKSKRPLVSQADSGIYIAAGLGGMGVALGMQTGRQAAVLISGTS